MKNRLLVLLLTATLIGIAFGCGTTSYDDSSSSATAGASSAIPNLGPAPAVTFQAMDGNTLPLDSLRGKVVLVNFWATWCEPCRAEIPELIEFQNKYASRGFTVLGVAMDQEGKSVVAPFVAKPQFKVNGQNVAMNYPIMIGNDALASQFGGILGLPTSYLISRDGKVVKKTIGIIDGQSVDQMIRKLLSGASDGRS